MTDLRLTTAYIENRKLELELLRAWMFENPQDWASSPARVQALAWTIERHEEEIRRLECMFIM